MATKKANPQVFLKFSINGAEAGTIVAEIFEDITPLTAANFIELCRGTQGFGYANSKIHRIIKGFVMQGGDIVNGTGNAGKSIYGARFRDENFHLKHDARGILSMANAGPNTNNSQFFITFNPCPFLDNRHVVFGRVVGEKSFATLSKLEEVGVPSDNYTLTAKVVITECGIVE